MKETVVQAICRDDTFFGTPWDVRKLSTRFIRRSMANTISGKDFTKMIWHKKTSSVAWVVECEDITIKARGAIWRVSPVRDLIDPWRTLSRLPSSASMARVETE